MYGVRKHLYTTASGMFVKEISDLDKKWLAHTHQPFFSRTSYDLLTLFARRRPVCIAVVLLVVNPMTLIVLAMINLLPFLMG